MCDYIFVSRNRRAVTISNSVRRVPSPRPMGGRIYFAASRCSGCLLRGLADTCAPRVLSGVRQTWVDIAGHRILLHESIADDKSTVSAISTRLWRCAVGTAAWLAEQGHLFDAQFVLEVGAGTGLCSLILAATSTARVISSDLDEAAVELVRSAARFQFLPLEAAISFDLGGTTSLPAASWLIACDVMYVPELAVILARRCAEQLQRGGHVLVTDPDRKPRADFQMTLDALLGTKTHFIRLQEAPPLEELIRVASHEGKPALVLLLVDEHCRAPFWGS